MDKKVWAELEKPDRNKKRDKVLLRLGGYCFQITQMETQSLLNDLVKILVQKKRIRR
jgi:hypothetical protein